MSLITDSMYVQLFIALAVIASCTRLISARKHKSDNSWGGNPRRIPTLPYWIPYLGHVPSLISSQSRFLQRCSRQSASGIFSLNLFGAQHHVVSTLSLIRTIFEEPSTTPTFDTVRWSILVNVFGANKEMKEEYMRALGDAQACLIRGLLLEPGVSDITRHTVLAIQEHVPNLVSFSESVVDQAQWERAANANPLPPKDCSRGASLAVGVDLFALIRNFVCSVALPLEIGTEFLDAYPKVLDDLWDLDAGFGFLALGLPRWLPIPSLTKAHIARRNLLQGVASYQEAIDNVAVGEKPRQPWLEVKDVGPLMSERSAAWRANDTPSGVKAPFDLSVLWAMSTKSSTLIFWMLTHIWAAPGLVEKVREEIGSFAKATQPPQIFGIPEPARLQIDIDGLAQSCSLLKACFYESVRLHSVATSVRSLSKTSEFHDTPEDANPGVQSHTYVLEAGKFVAAPLSVHHHDPSFFKSPNTFDPSRFLRDVEGKQIVVMGTLKPWGVGIFACPGQIYAEKGALAFAAAVLALWNFEPADLRGWTIPRQSERSIVSVPSAELRVRITPRPLQ